MDYPAVPRGKHKGVKAYDVFLSFAGEENRKDLAIPMWKLLTEVHKLKVFLDKFSIFPGEHINRTINSAIKHSTLFVPLFTDGFYEKLAPGDAPGDELRYARNVLGICRISALWFNNIERRNPQPEAVKPLLEQSIVPMTLEQFCKDLCEKLKLFPRQAIPFHAFEADRLKIRRHVHILHTSAEHRCSEAISKFFKDHNYSASLSADDVPFSKRKESKDIRGSVLRARWVFVVITEGAAGNATLQKYIDHAWSYAKDIVPISTSSRQFKEMNRIPILSFKRGITGHRGFDFETEEGREEFYSIYGNLLEQELEQCTILPLVSQTYWWEAP